MLGGSAAVEQASLFDGLALDPLAFLQDGPIPPEVDVGGREVAEALMVAVVVVVLDEGIDLGLVIARREIVLEQDPVLRAYPDQSAS